MGTIQELIQLVPPPANPTCSRGNWADVERELGIALPTDYKRYIEHYGQGELCSLFSIESPFGVSPLVDHWRNLTGYYEDWAGEVRPVPYPVYPQRPGLFPFGYYGDVNIIAWYTEGAPDSWPIVYCDRAAGFFLLKAIGFVQFLVLVLKGQSPLPRNVLGDEILQQSFIFRPSRSSS